MRFWKYAIFIFMEFTLSYTMDYQIVHHIKKRYTSILFLFFNVKNDKIEIQNGWQKKIRFESNLYNTIFFIFPYTDLEYLSFGHLVFDFYFWRKIWQNRSSTWLSNSRWLTMKIQIWIKIKIRNTFHNHNILGLIK